MARAAAAAACRLGGSDLSRFLGVSVRSPGSGGPPNALAIWPLIPFSPGGAIWWLQLSIESLGGRSVKGGVGWSSRSCVRMRSPASKA